MGEIKSAVEIVAAILGIIVLLGGAGSMINQTNVSRSLLTHGEKEKQKMLEGFILTIMFAVVVFIIGVVICLGKTKNAGANETAVSAVTEVSEEELVSEVNDELQAESEREPETEQSQNAEETSGDESNAADVLVLSVAIGIVVISVLASLGIWRREKKKIEYKDKSSFLRYFTLFGLIYITLFLLACTIFFAMSLLFKWYLIFGGLSSLVFGFFLFYFVVEVVPRYRDDVAVIRTVYEHKVVYLFEVKDNCVVAGDNYYFSRCDNYYLIGMDKLSNPLVSAENKEDVLLLKKNVTCNNKSRRESNEVLRFVICDYIKAKGVPGQDAVLDVNAAFNFGHNSVTYSITDGENTAEKTIEIGESSTVDWDGNVILM